MLTRYATERFLYRLSPDPPIAGLAPPLRRFDDALVALSQLDALSLHFPYAVLPRRA